MHSVRFIESDAVIARRQSMKEAELKALRAEVNRLRAMVGEPLLEEVPLPDEVVKQYQDEVYTSGNMSARMIRGAAPAVNPMFAGARQAAQMGAPTAPRPVATVMQPAPAPARAVLPPGAPADMVAMMEGANVHAQPATPAPATPPQSQLPRAPGTGPLIPVARRVASQEDLDETASRFSLIELRP